MEKRKKLYDAIISNDLEIIGNTIRIVSKELKIDTANILVDLISENVFIDITDFTITEVIDLGIVAINQLLTIVKDNTKDLNKEKIIKTLETMLYNFELCHAKASPRNIGKSNNVIIHEKDSKNYWYDLHSYNFKERDDILTPIRNRFLEKLKANASIREEYLKDEESPKNQNDQKSAAHIIFQINKNCNFKCTYCYEGLDKVTEIIDTDDIDKIVEGIRKYYNILKREIGIELVSFSILGGEPTLVNSEITQKLTKALLTLELRDIHLITNGYSAKRIKSFFCPEFPKDKIKIQISYDGAGLHDKYRLNSAKKSSREMVKQTASELIQEDYRVTLKPTLPMEAFKNNELIKEAVLDFEKLDTELFKKRRSGNYYVTMDGSSLLAQILKKELLNEDEKLKFFEKVFEFGEWLLELELDRFSRGKPPLTRWFNEIDYSANKTTCSLGDTLIGLDETGEARFCHRVEYNSASKYDSDATYGKIFDEKFEENFLTKRKSIIEYKTKAQALDLPSKCKSCKTVSCVKCPMINIESHENFTGNVYFDMFAQSEELTCDINLNMSYFITAYEFILRSV